GDVVHQVASPLVDSLGLQVSLVRASVEEKSVEYRNIYVHPDCSIPALKMTVVQWNGAYHAESTDRRTNEIAFGVSIFFRGLVGVLKCAEVGTLVDRISNQRIDVGRWRDHLRRLVHQVHVLQVGIAEDRRERR